MWQVPLTNARLYLVQHTTTFTLCMNFAGDASQKVTQNFCRSGGHVLFIYSESCEAYHTCTLDPFLYTSPHIIAVHRAANADHFIRVTFPDFLPTDSGSRNSLLCHWVTFSTGKTAIQYYIVYIRMYI